MGRHDDLLARLDATIAEALTRHVPKPDGTLGMLIEAAAALRDEIANGDRLRRDVGHVIAAYEDLPHVIDVPHLMGLLRKATCTLPDGVPGLEPWQRPTSDEVEP